MIDKRQNLININKVYEKLYIDEYVSGKKEFSIEEFKSDKNKWKNYCNNRTKQLKTILLDINLTEYIEYIQYDKSYPYLIPISSEDFIFRLLSDYTSEKYRRALYVSTEPKVIAYKIWLINGFFSLFRDFDLSDEELEDIKERIETAIHFENKNEIELRLNEIARGVGERIVYCIKREECLSSDDWMVALSDLHADISICMKNWEKIIDGVNNIRLKEEIDKILDRELSISLFDRMKKEISEEKSEIEALLQYLNREESEDKVPKEKVSDVIKQLKKGQQDLLPYQKQIKELFRPYVESCGLSVSILHFKEEPEYQPFHVCICNKEGMYSEIKPYRENSFEISLPLSLSYLEAKDIIECALRVAGNNNLETKHVEQFCKKLMSSYDDNVFSEVISVEDYRLSLSYRTIKRYALPLDWHHCLTMLNRADINREVDNSLYQNITAVTLNQAFVGEDKRVKILGTIKRIEHESGSEYFTIDSEEESGYAFSLRATEIEYGDYFNENEVYSFLGIIKKGEANKNYIEIEYVEIMDRNNGKSASN